MFIAKNNLGFCADEFLPQGASSDDEETIAKEEQNNNEENGKF